MGHEVAHAFAKHGQERMTTSYGQQAGQLLIALGTDTKSSDSQKIWNTVYGVSSGLGVLKFSRIHEQEADRLGLIFMIMAGYDGKEAAAVWVRMSEKSKGSSQPEILSTHPSNAARIKDLRSYLPKANKLASKFNQAL